MKTLENQFELNTQTSLNSFNLNPEFWILILY